MAEVVDTKEKFRAAVAEALPEIARENPQAILAAIVGNQDAFRAAMEKSGMIVSPKITDPTAGVVDELQRMRDEGLILYGFGAPVRRQMARYAKRSFDPMLGRTTTTYLHGETEKMAWEWMRAFLNKGVHPDTNKPISDLARQLNEFTRAPATPLIPDPGTGGGFLVPLIVAAEIFEYMQERFILRNYVEVFVSAAPLQIPRRTSLITVQRFASATDTPEVNVAATLGGVKLSPELVGALTYIDPRLALAAAVGPVRWVIGQLAEALAKDYQRCIATGNAAIREPKGISTIPTSGAATADMASTFTFDPTSNQSKRDSVRKLFYTINQPHRESPRFKWITSNYGVQAMNSHNDLNMQPFKDAGPGTPPTYIGKEVIETSAIANASPGGSSETTTLLGGDMGQYGWVESPEGLTLQQTDVGGQAWTSNTIGVKIVQAVDGAPIIPQAFCNMASFT